MRYVILRIDTKHNLDCGYSLQIVYFSKGGFASGESEYNPDKSFSLKEARLGIKLHQMNNFHKTKYPYPWKICRVI